MQKTKEIDRIREICERFAVDMGYELVDAAFEEENTGTYLRIYVLKDGNLSLDDCEKYHMAVIPKLENFNYDFLEVCSPGIDRPVKTPRDAERAKGKLVEVRLYRPKDGKKIYQGVLNGLDSEGYHILLDGQELVFTPKETAVVKPVIDLSHVDFSKIEEELDL